MKRYRTAFVLASGPSLTLEDCMNAHGRGAVIAVNSTIFMAPFATHLFAADGEWWKAMLPYLRWRDSSTNVTTDNAQFPGEDPYAHRVAREGGFGIGDQGVAGHNSGHQAISFAWTHLRAKRIILLGFDCQLTDGKTHHHGDHPTKFLDGRDGLGNPSQTNMWHEHHLTLAEDARKKGVEILNCSRETALECYPRVTLHEVAHGK